MYLNVAKASKIQGVCHLDEQLLKKHVPRYYTMLTGCDVTCLYIFLYIHKHKHLGASNSKMLLCNVEEEKMYSFPFFRCR